MSSSESLSAPFWLSFCGGLVKTWCASRPRQSLAHAARTFYFAWSACFAYWSAWQALASKCPCGEDLLRSKIRLFTYYSDSYAGIPLITTEYLLLALSTLVAACLHFCASCQLVSGLSGPVEFERHRRGYLLRPSLDPAIFSFTSSQASQAL